MMVMAPAGHAIAINTVNATVKSTLMKVRIPRPISGDNTSFRKLIQYKRIFFRLFRYISLRQICPGNRSVASGVFMLPIIRTGSESGVGSRIWKIEKRSGQTPPPRLSAQKDSSRHPAVFPGLPSARRHRVQNRTLKTVNVSRHIKNALSPQNSIDQRNPNNSATAE